MKKQFAALALVLGLAAALPSNTVLAQDNTTTSGANPARGNDQSKPAPEAKTAADLDLEQLANMEVKVTSVSKKSEPLSQAPAAIFVLTQEDIRRGGFSTLPDALRMVPGLYVARTDSHNWQISTRGFSDLSNNKMLVLVDDRSVYSPVYGGVFWDALDMPLEDIDRVEVIRGPGGTLWGANAVNGVINIVTKSAEQTHGVLVSATSDLDDGYTATVQYGSQIGTTAHYRVFGKASYWEPFGSLSGGDLPTNFGMTQAGARLDWTASAKDAISLQAGSYDGRFRHFQFPTALTATYLLRGNHVLANWKHTFSGRSSTEMTAYCAWYARFGAPAEQRNTCNLEFQHSYEFTPRHSLIWGGSFLSTGDNLANDPAPYIPEQRRNNVVSGFAQYKVVIIPNRLHVFVGSKFEHNGYTGFEYQPQARAVWIPVKSHVLWVSVSRVIREPSRVNSDLDLTIPNGFSEGLPVFLHVHGNPNLESEHLYAYESGYRFQQAQSFSFDFALYYNQYTNLIANTPPAPEIFPTRIVMQTFYTNAPQSQTHGAELNVRWKPIRPWKISAGVTEIRGSSDALQATPKHLINLQSRIDLPHRIEFDAAFYHYSVIPVGRTLNDSSLPQQGVPAFTRVDVGVGWHINPQWLFSVWGRNLQSDRHVETRDTTFLDQAGYVPRSVAFKVMWQSKPEGK